MPTPAIANLDRSRRRARAEGNRAPTPGFRRVGDCMNAVIARVPSWFTVAQARRVAELKGVSHLLVDDKSGASGCASLATLASAPPSDLLARWTVRTSGSVDANASLEVAEDLLHAEGAACLPVTTGGMLVGTISLADLLLASDDDVSNAA
jgi:CBS domain-containing protein